MKEYVTHNSNVIIYKDSFDANTSPKDGFLNDDSFLSDFDTFIKSSHKSVQNEIFGSLSDNYYKSFDLFLEQNNRPGALQRVLHKFIEGETQNTEGVSEWRPELAKVKRIKDAYENSMIDHDNFYDFYPTYVRDKNTNKPVLNTRIPNRGKLICLCIGLKLSLSESEELLNAGNYSLGYDDFEELALRFFISKNNYNIEDFYACFVRYDKQWIGYKPKN